MKPSTVLLTLILLTALLTRCSTAANRTDLPKILPGSFLRNDPTYAAKACDGTFPAVCSSCNQLKLCIDTTDDTNNPVLDCPASAPYCSMSASVTTGVCQNTPDASIAVCTGTFIEFECTGSGHFANPYSCKSYYNCLASSATPELFNCAEGEQFDINTGYCLPSNSPCPTRTSVLKFKCTGVGYFADAYSCQTFYYCSGPAATPAIYSCPEGYKFRPKVNQCVLSATTCPKFACKADNPDSIFQPLPSSTQYYVYCKYDRSGTAPKLTDTLVFSCGEGGNYNPTSGKCVFTCPKDGLYVNTAYPKQYYQCYLSGGKLVYKDLLCTATQQFDATAKRCVAAS